MHFVYIEKRSRLLEEVEYRLKQLAGFATAYCPKCGGELVELEHVGFSNSAPSLWGCQDCHKIVRKTKPAGFTKDYALVIRAYRHKYHIFECF